MRRLLLLALTACATDFEVEETTDETTQELGTLFDLRAYWSPSRGDNAVSVASFTVAGYSQYRIEGRIHSPAETQPPATLPLNTWFGVARGDYLTTTNPYWANGMPNEVRNNYTFIRLEGYVYDRPVAGTIPLQLWWNGTNGDNMTSSDPRYTSDTSQSLNGFTYVRAEGYVFPSRTEENPFKKERFSYNSSAASGQRDLLVLTLDWSDAQMRHTQAELDALTFGPSFPNVRAYTNKASGNRFTWRRGAVLGPYRWPDDPDTRANEADWDVAWEPVDRAPGDGGAMAFVVFEATNHSDNRHIIATPSGLVTQPHNDDYQARFSLDDLDGGSLENGDRIMLKTYTGNWVRENGDRLLADSTSRSTGSTFTVTGAPQILTHSMIRLQAPSGRYVTIKDDRSLRTTTYETGSNLMLHKAMGPSIHAQTVAAIKAATNAGYDFRVHDHDGDGVVDESELTIMMLHSTPEPNLVDAAGTRGADDIIAVTNGVETRISVGRVSAMDEDGTFMTFVHELFHTLLPSTNSEMYSETPLTTMGATMGPAGGGDSGRLSFLLDPYNRVRLGWVEPEIHAYSKAGGSKLLTSPAFGGRPLLLYDPRRYDTISQLGEFFYVEFRNGGYDEAVNANSYYDQDTMQGIAIWRVTNDADGWRAKTLRNANGLGIWLDSDGLVTLTYSDGTNSRFRLGIQNTWAFYSGSTSMSVEWDDDGALVPRIDNAPATATRGSLFRLDGVFPNDPARSTNVQFQFHNLSTNLWYMIDATPAFSPTWMQAYLPTTLPNGTYHAYARNNGQLSNPLPVTITN